jgi:hypothetical protein
MQDLTVPTDRLATGCRLKVKERSEQVNSRLSTTSFNQFGITTNPWTGTDRRILARLRQQVDGYGMVRLPDGPPLTNTETSAMLLKFADGVEEGYAAIYAQSERLDITVWAVRFKPGERDNLSTPTASVIDVGPIRAAIVGDVSPCRTAIETHLRSLGR